MQAELQNPRSYHMELQATLPSMQKGLIFVSVEEGVLANIGKYFMDQSARFRDYMTSLSDRLGNSFENESDTLTSREFYKAYDSVSGIVRNVTFQSVMDREVPVIMGLNVPYEVLTPELLWLVSDANKNMNKYVDRLSFTLSKFLTDQNYRISFKNRKDSVELKTIKEYNDRAQKFMSSSIDPRSTTDRLKVKDVISSISSLNSIAEDTNELAGKISYKELVKVESKLDEISEKVDLLVKYINDNENNLKVTKQTLEELVAYMDAVAFYITYSSTLMSMANLQVANVANLIKVIKM